MLYRKITSVIKSKLENKNNPILLVEGARQVGKSFSIRYVGKQLFKNFIEINLVEDKENIHLFENVGNVEDFHIALSSIAGGKLGNNDDTLIFLDEIQEYPRLFTLLKFLREENKYRYVASGSLLGVTMRKSVSLPLGAIDIIRMYPLDLEEFMIANNVGEKAIDTIRENFKQQTSLSEELHHRFLDLFKKYLITGGLPAVINEYLTSHNIFLVRNIQSNIHSLYSIDAAKYDEAHRLKIQRLYNLIPSNMENKKKRVIFKEIEGSKGKKRSDYDEEIEYLVNAGVCLEVKAISNPKFPLIETEHKNLLKLYLNDVGLLSNLLYRNNVSAILNDERSINLGSVYECAIAMELASHNYNLFYYDNRKNGEVDFLIDDYNKLTVVPIEVKSGKDYTIHHALNKFLNNPEYNIKKGVVISNQREVKESNGIVYIPVYMSICFDNSVSEESLIYI